MYRILILRNCGLAKVTAWKELTRRGNSEGLQEHSDAMRLSDIYHFIAPICAGLSFGPKFASVIISPMGGLDLSGILGNRQIGRISGGLRMRGFEKTE